MAWIGDGYCDDQNNVEGCQFDGGDCCIQPLVTDYCTECECHSKFVIIDYCNCKIKITSSINISFNLFSVGNPICIDAWIGDGICDDQNNIVDCLFDGGDCCLDPLDPLVTYYCTACECF